MSMQTPKKRPCRAVWLSSKHSLLSCSVTAAVCVCCILGFYTWQRKPSLVWLSPWPLRFPGPQQRQGGLGMLDLRCPTPGRSQAPGGGLALGLGQGQGWASTCQSRGKYQGILCIAKIIPGSELVLVADIQEPARVGLPFLWGPFPGLNICGVVAKKKGEKKRGTAGDLPGCRALFSARPRYIRTEDPS